MSLPPRAPGRSSGHTASETCRLSLESSVASVASPRSPTPKLRSDLDGSTSDPLKNVVTDTAHRPAPLAATPPRTAPAAHAPAETPPSPPLRQLHEKHHGGGSSHRTSSDHGQRQQQRQEFEPLPTPPRANRDSPSSSLGAGDPVVEASPPGARGSQCVYGSLVGRKRGTRHSYEAYAPRMMAGGRLTRSEERAAAREGLERRLTYEATSHKLQRRDHGGYVYNDHEAVVQGPDGLYIIRQPIRRPYKYCYCATPHCRGGCGRRRRSQSKSSRKKTAAKKSANADGDNDDHREEREEDTGAEDEQDGEDQHEERSPPRLHDVAHARYPNVPQFPNVRPVDRRVAGSGHPHQQRSLALAPPNANAASMTTTTRSAPQTASVEDARAQWEQERERRRVEAERLSGRLAEERKYWSTKFTFERQQRIIEKQIYLRELTALWAERTDRSPYWLDQLSVMRAGGDARKGGRSAGGAITAGEMPEQRRPATDEDRLRTSPSRHPLEDPDFADGAFDVVFSDEDPTEQRRVAARDLRRRVPRAQRTRRAFEVERHRAVSPAAGRDGRDVEMCDTDGTTYWAQQRRTERFEAQQQTDEIRCGDSDWFFVYEGSSEDESGGEGADPSGLHVISRAVVGYEEPPLVLPCVGPPASSHAPPSTRARHPSGPSTPRTAPSTAGAPYRPALPQVAQSRYAFQPPLLAPRSTTDGAERFLPTGDGTREYNAAVTLLSKRCKNPHRMREKIVIRYEPKYGRPQTGPDGHLNALPRPPTTSANTLQRPRMGRAFLQAHYKQLRSLEDDVGREVAAAEAARDVSGVHTVEEAEAANGGEELPLVLPRGVANPNKSNTTTNKNSSSSPQSGSPGSRSRKSASTAAASPLTHRSPRPSGSSSPRRQAPKPPPKSASRKSLGRRRSSLLSDAAGAGERLDPSAITAGVLAAEMARVDAKERRRASLRSEALDAMAAEVGAAMRAREEGAVKATKTRRRGPRCAMAGNVPRNVEFVVDCDDAVALSLSDHRPPTPRDAAERSRLRFSRPPSSEPPAHQSAAPSAASSTRRVSNHPLEQDLSYEHRVAAELAALEEQRTLLLQAAAEEEANDAISLSPEHSPSRPRTGDAGPEVEARPEAFDLGLRTGRAAVDFHEEEL